MYDRAMLTKTMKEQTFGVEIECYNIRPESASKKVAEFFGTNRSEFDGGYLHAYVAYDQKGRKWKFEHDGSIVSEYGECEVVTPVLTYDDMELLQGVVRFLRSIGAKSDTRHQCGVHVHVGSNGHTPATLRNLVNVMAGHENILVDAIGFDHRRDTWCRVTDKGFLKKLNDKKPKTMEDLKELWYEQAPDYDIDWHYNPSRYHMVNLHSTFQRGTVEFRMFQFNNPTAERKGGLHAGLIKAYVQLALAMNNYAKNIKWAKPEEPVSNYDNPRYTMKMWMVTMGMVGEEFDTARKLLMQRLAGSSDCRCGDRRLCAHREVAVDLAA